MSDENTKDVDEKVAEDEKEKQEIILINEETIKSKIYIVRGQKVMLDFELAEIYGYTTTRFNEQVKNNIESFYNYLKSKELEDDLRKVFRLHNNFDKVNTEINNCKNKLWRSEVSYSGDVIRQSLTYAGGKEEKTRTIEYLVSWSLSKRKIREECARVMNILCSFDKKYTNARTFIIDKQEEN